MEFVESMQQYFRGEKLESAVILAISCALLVASVGTLAGVAHPFARGLAVVLLVTGLLGGVVGATIVLRTDRQVAELLDLYATDRDRFAAEEGTRIQTVVRSFRTYKLAYSAAVIAAVLLLWLTPAARWHGVAVGLLLFAALGFAVDHFAEARAITYADQVRAQAGPVSPPAHLASPPSTPTTPR